MQKIIVNTDDGASTIYLPNIDECYHSTKGALHEAQHVYIDNGFKHRNLTNTKILEMGFGTGLNAYLTMLSILESEKKIHYTSIELYPLDEQIINNLNYPNFIYPQHKDLFYQLHNAPWGEKVNITDNFIIEKLHLDFNNFYPKNAFDVVYFDAFAPEKQPELWTLEIFKKIYNAMNTQGVITTYCAKGVIRRTLQECGFTTERLPGPINGKREILRGTKIFNL